MDDKEADNLRFISEIPQRDNLVPVGDHNFGKLVLAKHRPYHTVVLFTTANRGGECSACEYVVIVLLQHRRRVCVAVLCLSAWVAACYRTDSACQARVAAREADCATSALISHMYNI